MWTIILTFSDGITCRENTRSYHRVKQVYQTWRDDPRTEDDRPQIKVFPPHCCPMDLKTTI